VVGKFTEDKRMGKAFARKFLCLSLIGRNLQYELSRTFGLGRSRF
jgi:hypothetical protein